VIVDLMPLLLHKVLLGICRSYIQLVT
jgi:hypothetical protein